MAFSARQNRLYKHRVDLWEETTPFDSGGVALSPQWTLVATDVQCHLEIRPNLDAPGPFGRYQADNQFVLDILHLDERQRIASDQVLINRTVDPDGSRSENFGLCWRVRGPARSISRAPGRNFGKRSVFVYLEPEPPADVKAAI